MHRNNATNYLFVHHSKYIRHIAQLVPLSLHRQRQSCPVETFVVFTVTCWTTLTMNSSSSPTENFLAPFSDGNWSSTLVSFNLDDACCPNGTVDQCTWSDYNSSIDLSVLRLQGFRKYLLEACLTLSAFSLVLSFLVYSLVPELRTVPGKCLMGLIVSEFITDTLVIAALQNQPCTLACSIIGVLIHYFYLTIFCWTSVIGK